ncbi:hypothetical protein S40288_09802 [Stachybotrys chartarum IBT 40288]|nr:hypothetical protein S40288_09802 [Stachybotrys chartarum IBT 40288]
MAPQLTVKGPEQRRHGGHSSNSGSSRANKEARYPMKLQISRSRREQDADSTYRPDIKPTDAVGSQFEPVNVPDRDFLVRQPLPPTPLHLFQQFLPEELVERWVHYKNEAPAPEPGAGAGPAAQSGRYHHQDHWKPTSIAEKASAADNLIPSHPIIQLMTFDRFFLLKRRLRIYDPDYVEIGVRLVEIGSIIGIDEGIIGFKGRSRHKVTIKTKPTPTGLKVWALATRGYLLQWARAVAMAPDNSLNEGSDEGSDSIIFSSSSEDSADEEALDIKASEEPLEEIPTQMMEVISTAKLPPLNPTQAVVIALVNKLPEGTYHVFLNNLFSSPDLFKALRILGIRAAGTCCTNCGLYRDIVIAKENDRKGKELWLWRRICSWPTPDNKVGNP